MIECLKNQERILFEVAVKFGPFDVAKLLAESYVLTVDVLELLHCLNCYPKQILDCVQSCKKYNDAATIYKWLCAYIGQQEAEDFFLTKCNFDENFLRYISLEALERHQCWDELEKRKADDILYKHGLYDKLSPQGLYKHQLFEKYFQKYWIITPEDNAVLDYLATKEKWDIIYKNFRLNKNKHNRNMLDFLVKHKRFTMIANENRMFLTTFPEGIAFLQKTKDYYNLSEAGLYDKVDWDEFLKLGTVTPINCAVKAKQWDALMRNREHWVLLMHFRLWRFIKSFF